MSNEDPQPGSCILEEPVDNIEQENGETNGLSRNQLKRIKARDRYLRVRPLRRAEEREKKKAKRVAMKEAGLGESLKRKRKTLKGNTMENSSCKIKIAVDMCYDDLMVDKDRRRCVIQLGWCYAANRRAKNPLQYYVTDFSGPSKEIYDSIESNKNQDIFIKEQPLEDIFEKENIVYLTADSDNILTTLDESKVYVIGGLVDHNAHKGLCLDRSNTKGYSHARLPIEEFVDMKARKVLTINHVFEIFVNFTETGDWGQSIFKVIPQRKGAERKNENLESIEEGNED